MLNENIEAVLFDWGGTLVNRLPPSRHGDESYKRILEVLDSNEDVDEIRNKLKQYFSEYKKWAVEYLIEVPEEVLMVKWLFKDYPLDKVLRNEKELFGLFQMALGPRSPREGVLNVLAGIKKKGYRIGLVSNHTGRRMVLDELRDFGLDKYMDCRIISTLEGIRKPDPALFYTALRKMDVSPDKCLYVGDNPSRDVVGARAAGIAKVVLIKSAVSGDLDNLKKEFIPDYIIENLSQLLEILPDKLKQPG